MFSVKFLDLQSDTTDLMQGVCWSTPSCVQNNSSSPRHKLFRANCSVEYSIYIFMGREQHFQKALMLYWEVSDVNGQPMHPFPEAKGLH
ncbi:hypothetical protein JTE90_029152 [Oedothorax gibbosus]|uniref:Uncharacterized protein n=1 Tax=Oedothorax gibbosus TaxID=931172 RepID=A0AAV6TKJ5_9ARAC|nr:hypothetical protein JTE90_029152 [Oedothorax gibbosus]